jgi:hypothetical protein
MTTIIYVSSSETLKIDKHYLALRIEKTFLGKDRISVDEKPVFEGKIGCDTPHTFSADGRKYIIENVSPSLFGGMVVYHLQIFQGDSLVHEGLYNRKGESPQSTEKKKASMGLQVYGFVGGAVAVFFVISANKAAGRSVFTSTIYGAIGGGLGSMVGFGIGFLFFKLRKWFED